MTERKSEILTHSSKSQIEGIVEFKDWAKIDLRVGKIVEVEEIADADKLYKLKIDIGSETKIVCAGLKEYYSKDDLKNKKVVLFVNLKPRILRSIESQGMILAADDEKGKVSLIVPDKEMEIGSRIR